MRFDPQQDDLIPGAGYPLHRENRENGPKKSLSGKTQGISEFGKTQGIWFAKVINSLILKVKDILIIAAKIPSFVYVIVTNHVHWHRGYLQSDRENTGNFKMKFEWVPCWCVNPPLKV